ncbi:Phage integrase family protein [Botrimarina colliarenosi]|uniref:Phage integrase family protein n=1 Tax=Botrimarina colliarenosi TaxID=2528001 RepID=A0A5C6ALJ0_9BACT|nr:tyrosine-type recombinase/integrase [Botrimarina colliarenosi]TWU00500.1 Phage integrase family protein [Botrimarina colliarenosi]
MPRKPTLRRSGDYWYTQAGSRDGVYFGRVSDVPYQVARARFGEYLAQLKATPLPTTDLPDRCVAEVCSRHLEWVLKNRSASLFHQRKSLLNGFCNFRIGEHNSARLPGAGLLVGELRAVKIVRAHVEAYLEHCRTTPSKKTGKPFGDKALRHIVVALKATWNWAADSTEDGGGELLPPDHRPLRKLPRGYVQPKDLSEIDLPTDTEIASLRRWCRVEPVLLPDDAEGWNDEFADSYASPDSLVFADLMRAYHATGARTSELCLALVSDFMPRTRQVCLGKHKRVRTQHNSTMRNIQVDEELLAILTRNTRDKVRDQPLFSHPDGRPWNQNEVNNRLRTIRALATEHDEPVRDHITPYSFRDLYISELLMIGVEPFKVAKMAGTSLKEIDRTYGHFFNQDLAEAQSRLSASRRDRFSKLA